MTQKNFRDNAQFRDELRALLDNPTLKVALEIVEDMAKPRLLPDVRPGVPHDTTVSQQHHKQWGIQHAVDRLKALSEPNPTEAEAEEEDAFWHTLPKEMKDAIKKKLQQG